MNPAFGPLVLMSVMTAPPAPPAPTVGFMNVERMVAHCRPGADSEAGMGDICVGYLAGSVDQLLSRQSDLPANRRTICLPPNATIGEIQRAVVIMLEKVEDQPTLSAAEVVARTMVSAYPC